MIAKTSLFIFAQAILYQCIAGQYYECGYNSMLPGGWQAAAAPPPPSPYGTAEWAPGYSASALSASHGGGLAITSASPIAPTGVSMASDNSYGGALGVAGALPYLGAVALEGALPTAGAGAVAYGCGNGNVAMLAEDFSPASYNGNYGYAPGYAPGYGPAYAPGYGPAYAPGYGLDAYGYAAGSPAEFSYAYAAPQGYEAVPAYGYRSGCMSIY